MWNVIVVVLMLAFLSVLNVDRLAAQQQQGGLLIADFDSRKNSGNLGGSFGTWDKDPNDPTQGCRMSFAGDDALGSKDGMSVRLDYDVDSPNPAFNGFWLKLDHADVSNYRALSFYLKGDATTGYTPKIKVEIKDKKGGQETSFIEGITDQWRRFSVPLKIDRSIKKPLSEFTIVFDDINSRPKRGTIMIDAIEFTTDGK